MEFELIYQYDFGPCDFAYLCTSDFLGNYYMISVILYASIHINFSLDIRGNILIRFRFQVTGDHIGAPSFNNLLGAAAVSK